MSLPSFLSNHRRPRKEYAIHPNLFYPVHMDTLGSGVVWEKVGSHHARIRINGFTGFGFMSMNGFILTVDGCAM